jgi:hypothetical protein
MERASVAVESVRNLQANRKQLLEEILGQKLKDNQQIFVMALTPGRVPSQKDREESLAALKQTWKKVDEHMKEHGITDGEFDATVDEAVHQVRRWQE